MSNTLIDKEEVSVDEITVVFSNIFGVLWSAKRLNKLLRFSVLSRM